MFTLLSLTINGLFFITAWSLLAENRQNYFCVPLLAITSLLIFFTLIRFLFLALVNDSKTVVADYKRVRGFSYQRIEN